MAFLVFWVGFHFKIMVYFSCFASFQVPAWSSRVIPPRTPQPPASTFLHRPLGVLKKFPGGRMGCGLPTNPLWVLGGFERRMGVLHSNATLWSNSPLGWEQGAGVQLPVRGSRGGGALPENWQKKAQNHLGWQFQPKSRGENPPKVQNAIFRPRFLSVLHTGNSANATHGVSLGGECRPGEDQMIEADKQLKETLKQSAKLKTTLQPRKEAHDPAAEEERLRKAVARQTTTHSEETRPSTPPPGSRLREGRCPIHCILE